MCRVFLKEKKLLPLVTVYETIIQNHIQFNEKKITVDVLFGAYFIHCFANVSHITNTSLTAVLSSLRQ